MKKLADLIADCRARAARGKRAPLREEARLPQWPEKIRGVPNAILRSSLFASIKKGRRRFVKGERLVSITGIEIYYTGERLDQADLDVYEGLLHFARLYPLGSPYFITSYALLKLMGRTDTGKNRAILQARIERLRANAVRIRQGRFTFIGGLLDEACKDEQTHAWMVVLNPRLQVLYGVDQFTQVEWAVRQALSGKPLAQWLHGFYASHATPFPMRAETLLKLAGSEDNNQRSAQQTLRKALVAVVEASAAYGQRFSYEIRGGLVCIEKTAVKRSLRKLRG